MIGAMPAVAVRHERRRAEKRGKRPSQLFLGGPWLPPSPSASPSPHLDRLPEYYLFGRVSALHMVVGSLLLGGVLLVVGLVQLSPGAEAAAHRYYLLAAGAAFICLGLAMTALRCFCMHCHVKGVGGPSAGTPGTVGGRSSSGVHVGTAPHTVSSIEGLVTPPNHHHSNNHHHHHHHHHQSSTTPASEADALIRPPAPEKT